ncbi:MAG: SCO family protein [Deltaproteobacteria bacterium]|nr:SCO family protein [Deltaproteobacteria bacterium]
MSALRRAAARERLSWGLLAIALLLPAGALIGKAARDGALGGLAAHGGGLSDYGTLPDFALTERSGRTLRRADLAGAPWIADFVYTHCEGACPALSARMARLHRRLADRVRLVSFSVDPGRDTPVALSAYADRLGASAGGWLFVTGDRDAMRRLIAAGFRLAVVDAPAGGPEGAAAITHSEKVVLVDAELRIRRYYDGGADPWIDEAVRDLESLGVAIPPDSG